MKSRKAKRMLQKPCFQLMKDTLPIAHPRLDLFAIHNRRQGIEAKPTNGSWE